MDRSKADAFATPESVTLKCRGGPVDSRKMTRRWTPPPSPVAVRLLAFAIPIGTLIGVPMALRAHGQGAGGALFAACVLVVGELILLWFVFAIRCAYLESRYAPDQRHYRTRLMIGFLVLVIAIVMLFWLMARSSRNSRGHPGG